MPRLTVETIDAEKPILFIVGEKSPLIPKFVEEYRQKFKIALISADSPYETGKDFFIINPENATQVKNLKEKIEYAIVVCDSENIKEYLGPVFDKFVADHTKTILICGLENLSEFSNVVSAIHSYPNFYVLLTNDIYSEEENFNLESEIRKLIEDALFIKEVRLFGNDLQPILSIYIKDVLKGVTQLLLGPSTKNRFYYLFYKHPQTFISAIHILQRREPDLEITYLDTGTASRYKEFSEIEDAIKEIIDEKWEYLDRYLDGFEKSIEDFLSRGPIEKEEEIVTIIAGPKHTLESQKNKISYIAKALFFALFLFIFLQIGLAVGSFLLLKDSATNLKNGKYENAIASAKTSYSFFNLASPMGTIISTASQKLGSHKIAENYSLYSNVESLANVASTNAENLLKIQKGISNEVLNQTIADAIYLYFKGQELSSANHQISSVITPDLPKILSLSQVAQDVLGFNGEKHYLLLFQNNGELRPTGGFIGSTGDLIVENGKIKKIDLQDVYQNDGQLKLHVEPYYIVRRFLQPHLYLRDSNFDPDFQTSASAAALLYNLETGKKVDGVIAINFEAVRQIIGAIGPIELTSYHQTLNSDNAFDFLEKTIDSHFFPGSTQKRDVINALFDKIMLTIQNRNAFAKVISLIPKLASEKEILFAFNQASVQDVFSSLGYGDELSDTRQINTKSVNDFLSINEANIGVNKANVGISRSVSYTTSFTTHKMSSKITYSLNNNGSDGYNAFIRFIVPLGSSISNIKIDNTDQKIIPAITDPKVYEKRNFAPSKGLEVNQEIENGKTIFGFQINVEPHGNQILELTYDNGATLPTTSIVDYSLLFLKQPGTGTFPLDLNIIYGSNFTPNEVENAKLENGVVVINKTIKTDTTLNAEFLRR